MSVHRSEERKDGTGSRAFGTQRLVASALEPSGQSAGRPKRRHGVSSTQTPGAHGTAPACSRSVRRLAGTRCCRPGALHKTIGVWPIVQGVKPDAASTALTGSGKRGRSSMSRSASERKSTGCARESARTSGCLSERKRRALACTLAVIARCTRVSSAVASVSAGRSFVSLAGVTSNSSVQSPRCQTKR